MEVFSLLDTHFRSDVNLWRCKWYPFYVFKVIANSYSLQSLKYFIRRLFYSGAEYKQMPQILSMIQVRHHTPVPAVIAMCLLSLVYLMFQDIGKLMDYVGFSTWLAIGLAVLCIPYLRWKRPDLARPIKVPMIFPIIFIIATLFILILPIIEDPYTTGYGTLAIASGIPVYLIFIAWKNKPLWFEKLICKTPNTQETRLISFSLSDAATIRMQKLFIVIPSEKAQEM